MQRFVNAIAVRFAMTVDRCLQPRDLLQIFAEILMSGSRFSSTSAERRQRNYTWRAASFEVGKCLLSVFDRNTTAPRLLSSWARIAFCFYFFLLFSGDLPKELGKLVHLQSIDTTRNSIGGKLYVPAFIMRCMFAHNFTLLQGNCPRNSPRHTCIILLLTFPFFCRTIVQEAQETCERVLA